MDFYAHSNWVELGKSNIIDNGDGLWNPLTPGANIGGLTVLEGEIKNKNFLPYPATIDLSNPKVPMVSFGAGKERLPGLISGQLIFPYEAAQDKCPTGSPGHWDHFLFYTSANGPGLSKDNPGRFGHYVALDLARKQVKHEWCRLVNLVKQSSGDAGVSKLYDEWVKNDDADQDKAQCSKWKGTLEFDLTQHWGSAIETRC